MAPPTRLSIAKKDIFSAMDTGPKVLRTRDIAALMRAKREFWRLAQNTRVSDLVDFLTQKGSLKTYTFQFPDRPETLHTWGTVAFEEILQELKPKCYFSHYSALSFHSLTEQTPTTYYLTFERTYNSERSLPLSQELIDQAFTKPEVTTHKQATINDRAIILVSGRATQMRGIDQLVLNGGVHAPPPLIKVTDLERTLIDAVVRPNYCGGVWEVLNAFERARNRVSINSLCAQLRQYKFQYPYHQAIGFYLERAGYGPKQLDLLRIFPQNFDFYLTKAMQDVAFDKNWRIFYPAYL
ncbi:MAG: hypothetical protein ACK4FF_10340 [Limnobacter sp.]|uniref:type IV toxin-antitoxin system AbiEi family antitoxin domain-containing protein n=1 Tax=Limnobacter sp. TaxID=2003368 RepID=UPI00391C9A00